jgi:hypothetical protein
VEQKEAVSGIDNPRKYAEELRDYDICSARGEGKSSSITSVEEYLLYCRNQMPLLLKWKSGNCPPRPTIGIDITQLPS